MSANFFNKYPYTDFHELNLDYLLDEFKTLKDNYQDIIDWIENDAANYDTLVARITNLETDTRYLQRLINEQRIYIDDQISIVNQNMAAQYTRITREYTALCDNVLLTLDSAVADLMIHIENVRIELIEMISDGDAAVMQYVQSYLDTFIQNLPDYESLIVNNPVRGQQTTIQTAINDLYDYFNVYGLTAQEYDDKELTAAEYDSYQITAHDYDTLGLQILGPNSYYLMRSPFTGQMAPVPDVIMDLYELHRTNALTASAYDALDMTATYYDGLQIEALDYDLNGI